MNHDDDDEVEYTEVEIPAVRFNLIDLVIITIDSFADYLNAITVQLCKHANWKIGRKMLEADARLEIERMVKGE